MAHFKSHEIEHLTPHQRRNTDVVLYGEDKLGASTHDFSGRELIQMVVCITKLSLNDEQPFKIVTKAKLFGDAHTAMGLHSIFTDKKGSFADEMF